MSYEITKPNVIIEFQPRHYDTTQYYCTSPLGKSGEGWQRLLYYCQIQAVRRNGGEHAKMRKQKRKLKSFSIFKSTVFVEMAV